METDSFAWQELLGILTSECELMLHPMHKNEIQRNLIMLGNGSGDGSDPLLVDTADVIHSFH